MKIAVCDDIIMDQKGISEYILQYADKNMVDIKIDTFTSGKELLSAFEKFSYKAVFLDIYMNGLTGVDTAFRIRELDDECIIIFTTTSPDHRAEGFEVGAAHYLLKPITYDKVETALKRCKRIFSQSERYFNVIVDRHSIKILMKDVIYIEAYGKTVLIHTTKENFKTYMTLSDISKLLNGDPFLNCHRSFIVNMNYITGIHEDFFQLSNGNKTPIPRNGRQEIKDRYSRYFLSTIRGHDDA